MKKIITISLLMFISNYLAAASAITGIAAQKLYNLLPAHSAGATAIPNMPVNITGIKFAGVSIKCALRSDNSYKCMVPNKDKNGIIWLNGESSEIIYKSLAETGSSIMHLDNRTLACEVNDMEPESVVYLCSIH